MSEERILVSNDRGVPSVLYMLAGVAATRLRDVKWQ